MRISRAATLIRSRAVDKQDGCSVELTASPGS
jgi:hypothetical protein